MSQITTHVLDTSTGQPAEGIDIVLSEGDGEQWKEIARGTTDSEGRIGDLLETDRSLDPGPYRMVFRTKEYFDRKSIETFYPEVTIDFNTFDREHYHIPLLLNPFGYTTYRGS